MGNVCTARMLKEQDKPLANSNLDDLKHEADPKRSDYRVDLTHSFGREDVYRCKFCGCLYATED